MNRRDFVTGMGAAALAASCGRQQFSADMVSKIPTDLSFDIFSAPGDFALDAWTVLTEQHTGSASVAILGPSEDLEYLADDGFIDSLGTPASILEKAGSLTFPGDFRADLRKQMEQLLEQYKDDPDLQAMFAESGELGLAEDMPVGDWPTGRLNPRDLRGPVIVSDWTGRVHAEVLLGVFPTADWTEIPAYLPFGGWNACPLPQWHVSALRYWRDRWGAQLVSIGHDTIEMQVQSKPQSREDAIALAREQYDYCADIVDQGVGSIAALAHTLMASEWWFFWWD